MQQDILKRTYENETDAAPFDQMWCMYKEVQGYFAQGVNRSLSCFVLARSSG